MEDDVKILIIPIKSDFTHYSGYPQGNIEIRTWAETHTQTMKYTLETEKQTVIVI